MIAFGVVLVFSVIALGLNAYWLSLGMYNYTSLFSYTPRQDFNAMGVAVSVISMVTIVPMLVVSLLRKGAITSWVAVELGWVGFLWVLWIASAGLSTSSYIYRGDCSAWSGYYDYYFEIYYPTPELEGFCRQYGAMQAFAWLNFLILFGYFILLLALSILSYTKGNKNVFLTDCTTLSFNGAPGQQQHQQYPGGMAGTPMQMRPDSFAGYPPMTQQQQQVTPVPTQYTGQTTYSPQPTNSPVINV